MKNNYHSHTTYCNHATFEPEELVKYAIKKGYKIFGFSEHCYFDEAHPKYRLNANNEMEYVAKINELKKKYQDKIKILCGFECDLISPLHKNYDLVNYAASKKDIPGVDYLIIGHHFYPSKKHSYVEEPTNLDIKKYIEILEKAFKTKAFAYLAHPDCFINGTSSKEKKDFLIEAITDLMAKYNVPGGININALSENKLFPSLEFWKVAAKKGVKAILELDCHDKTPFLKKHIQEAYNIAKKAKVELILKLNIK